MRLRHGGDLALFVVLLWGCTPAVHDMPRQQAAPPPAAVEVPAPQPIRLAHAGVGPVDRVLVDKSERRLYLLRDGAVIAWVPVGLGRNPVGPKTRLGDRRTPEGEYVLDWRNPSSRFHRSIHISYPNEADLERAFDAGADPGGGIFLHGTPDPVLLGRDWTAGCIALSNEDIDLLWVLLSDGTPITIRP